MWILTVKLRSRFSVFQLKFSTSPSLTQSPLSISLPPLLPCSLSFNIWNYLKTIFSLLLRFQYFHKTGTVRLLLYKQAIVILCFFCKWAFIAEFNFGLCAAKRGFVPSAPFLSLIHTLSLSLPLRYFFLWYLEICIQKISQLA